LGEVIVRYDSRSNSLDVWFGNPTDEFVSEEVKDGVILKMDKDGNVIGVEKLNLLPPEAWKAGEPVIVNAGGFDEVLLASKEVTK